MFNHARTLLMNHKGELPDVSSFLDDQLIPNDFMPGKLNTSLVAARRILFGMFPDKSMLNYRCRQLLSLVALTDLQTFVTQLDSRITYNFDAAVSFSPSVMSNNSVDQVYLTGEAAKPDFTGICNYSYIVEKSGGNVIITKSSTTLDPQSFVPGNSYSLPSSDFLISFSSDNLPGVWSVRGFAEPSQPLPSLALSLGQLGEDKIIDIFGLELKEPFTTFKQCWENHPQFAYRLSGFIMAIVYRTEALRRDE